MKYCYECGTKLAEIHRITACWITIYKCPGCFAGYLDQADMKSEYSLIKLMPGIVNKLAKMNVLNIEKHCGLIKQYDCKTLRTVEFENAILAECID